MKYYDEFKKETGLCHKGGDETGYNQYVDDCYIHWLEEKVPQNLPKADAYSLLAEVRAWLKQNKNYADHYCVDVEVVRVEKLDDFLFKYISEHFFS